MIKRILKLNYYKNCLLINWVILKSRQIFNNEANNVFTEEIIKIALSSNDDKRLYSFNKTTSYLYGTGVGKVCTTELLKYLNIKW